MLRSQHCLRPLFTTPLRSLLLPRCRFSSAAITLATLKQKPNVVLAGAVQHALKQEMKGQWSDSHSKILSLGAADCTNEDAINKAKEDGILVYVDYPTADMSKVEAELDMSKIEGNYDVRVLVGEGMTPSEVAGEVIKQIGKDERFVSTRTKPEDQDRPVHFFETVRRGLAPDGGLYFPREIPKMSLSQLERLVPLSYEERALRILEQFPVGTLPPATLKQMLTKAYSTFSDPSNPLPTSHLEKNQYLLEEYHGPTASFKDLALQLTPQLFWAAVQNSGEEKQDFLLITATSGDTGAAALHGFEKLPNVPVVVLYPKGGVSPLQEAQMATCAGDVCVISVESDFDFCQALVKDIFNSDSLREELKEKYDVGLTSGNSMNWGRLFPQIPYTFSAYLDLVKTGAIKMGDPMDLCVPTGNFGNILGGVIAKRMGLPVRDLVVACNENNILADWVRTGEFDRRHRTIEKTISPSIDILLPSNLERYLYLESDRDSESVKQWFTQFATEGNFTLPPALHEKIRGSLKAGFCDGAATAATIRDVNARTGVLLDPHTAVGKVVADAEGNNDEYSPMVIAATAHFGKFPTAVLESLGMTKPDPKTLDLGSLLDRLATIDTKTTQHAELAALGGAKIVHEIEAPADADVILGHVRSFLKGRK